MNSCLIGSAIGGFIAGALGYAWGYWDGKKAQLAKTNAIIDDIQRERASKTI